MLVMDGSGILHVELEDSDSNMDGVKTRKVACLDCRALKRRCDGLRPVCGPCFKKGLNRACVYTTPPSAARGRDQPTLTMASVSSADTTAMHSAALSKDQLGPTASVACSTCRARKKRCDRNLPVCGACATYGLKKPCSYHELTNALKSEHKVKNREVVPVISKRTPFSSSAIGNDGNDRRKRPRVSFPAKLGDDEGRVEAEADPSRPLSAGPSARFTHSVSPDLPPIVTGVDSSASEPGATNTAREIPSRHREKSPNALGTFKNGRGCNTAQSTSSNSAESVQHEVITQKHSDGSGDTEPTTPVDFLSRLQQVVATRTDSSKPGLRYRRTSQERRQSYNDKCMSSLRNLEPQSLKFDLPPRESADHLVQIYLKWENVDLPIFDIVSFNSTYKAFWDGNDFPGDPHAFYALLNMVFSLACFAIGKPRRGEASSFYDRAQTSMHSGSVCDEETVDYVQMYVLSSRYLYAAGFLGPAWSEIGLAISLAQSLGLHLTSGSQAQKSREDTELVRKVWHCCMVTQRAFAMARGLSTVASPSLVRYPAPLESEYLDLIFGGEQSPDTERPSIIEFFNSTAKLYGKFEEIATYQDELRLVDTSLSAAKLKSVDLGPFINLDRFLSDWKELLPPFFQSGSNHPALQNPIVRRQCNILEIQYLHTHLVLRRPFLAIIATSRDDSLSAPEIKGSNNRVQDRYSIETPLSTSIVRNSAVQCVVVARKILDILHRYRNFTHEEKDLPDLIPPWWDNIGYAYACSTVIIASRTCPLIRAELSIEFIKESLQLGVKLLKSYVGYSDKASKCLSALKALVGATGGLAADEDNSKRENMPRQSSKHQLRDAGDAEDVTATYPESGMGKIGVAWLESLPADLDH